MKKKPGINKDHSTRVKTPDITALKKKSKIKKLTTENTNINITSNLQKKAVLKSSLNVNMKTIKQTKKTKFAINNEKKEDLKIVENNNLNTSKEERPKSATKKIMKTKNNKKEEKKKNNNNIMNKTGDNFYKPKITSKKINNNTNNNQNKIRKKSIDVALEKKNKRVNDEKIKIDKIKKPTLNKTVDNKKVKSKKNKKEKDNIDNKNNNIKEKKISKEEDKKEIEKEKSITKIIDNDKINNGNKKEKEEKIIQKKEEKEDNKKEIKEEKKQEIKKEEIADTKKERIKETTKEEIKEVKVKVEAKQEKKKEEEKEEIKEKKNIEEKKKEEKKEEQKKEEIKKERKKEIKYIFMQPKKFESNYKECLYLTLKSGFINPVKKLNLMLNSKELYQSLDKNKLIQEFINYYNIKGNKNIKAESINNIEKIKFPFRPSERSLNSLNFIDKEEENKLMNELQHPYITDYFKFLLILLNEKIEGDKNIFQFFFKDLLEKYQAKNIKNLMIKNFVNNGIIIDEQQFNLMQNMILIKPDLLSPSTLLRYNRAVAYTAFFVKDLFSYLNLKTEDGKYYYQIRANLPKNEYQDKINKLKLLL